MKWIEYRGFADVVEVPTHQLEAQARTPVEVADDVAADLTAGGASQTWVEVSAPPKSKTAKED
jgi:hypothetical protein